MFNLVGIIESARNFFFKRQPDTRPPVVDNFSPPVVVSRLTEPPSKRSRLDDVFEDESHLSYRVETENHSPMIQRIKNKDVVVITSTPLYQNTKFVAPRYTSPIVQDISDDEDDENEISYVTTKYAEPSMSRSPIKDRSRPADKIEVIDLVSPPARRWNAPPVISDATTSRYVSGHQGPSCLFSERNRSGVTVHQQSALRNILFQTQRSPASEIIQNRLRAAGSSDFKQQYESAKSGLEKLFPELNRPSTSTAAVSESNGKDKCSSASTRLRTGATSESSATSSGSSSSGVSQSTDMASGSSTERLNEWTARSPMEDLNARFQALDPTNLRHKLRDTSTKEQNWNRIEKLNVETKLRRDARILRGKPAADDVRDRLRLEGLVLEEKELVEEEEEFPELTDEQEDVVDRVIGRGSEDEVISKGFSIEITRRDLRTLVGLNWLNDEVINFYLQLVMERGGKGGLPSVYVMNTFFYAKIMLSGHAAVKRWTKKVDIFEFQLILIPVHLGNHWCLAVVDVPEKLIKYYDSLGGRNPRGLSAIMEYLKAEHVEKKGKAMDLTGWHSMAMTDIPLQENGSDCGMFTLRFAEYVSRDADITFTQENMVYFRRRTIFEIATRRLM